MTEKTRIAEFTESEFMDFLRSIIDPADSITERELDALIFRFKKISEHPQGADLIYWPESEGLDAPEEILRIIKEWRAANGKEGFKSP